MLCCYFSICCDIIHYTNMKTFLTFSEKKESSADMIDKLVALCIFKGQKVRMRKLISIYTSSITSSPQFGLFIVHASPLKSIICSYFYSVRFWGFYCNSQPLKSLIISTLLGTFIIRHSPSTTIFPSALSNDAFSSNCAFDSPWREFILFFFLHQDPLAQHVLFFFSGDYFTYPLFYLFFIKSVCTCLMHGIKRKVTGTLFKCKRTTGLLYIIICIVYSAWT